MISFKYRRKRKKERYNSKSWHTVICNSK